MFFYKKHNESFLIHIYMYMYIYIYIYIYVCMCVCNHVYARYLSTLIVGTRSIFAFVVGVKLIARDCAIFRFICMTAKRLWLAPRSFTSTYWWCMYITCTLTPYTHTHTHIYLSIFSSFLF